MAGLVVQEDLIGSPVWPATFCSCQALLTSIGRMGSRLRAGNYFDEKLIEVSRLTFMGFEDLISFVTELKWHAKIEA